MSIRITHIRLSDGVRDHEHISDLRWTSLSDGGHGESSKASIVSWIDGEGGRAFVGPDSARVRVDTVHPAFGQAFLRAEANGSWTDNLLALEEF